MGFNSGYVYAAAVSRAESGWPLPDWLATRYAHTTAPDWIARIIAGEVRVNDAVATPDQRLRAGDTISWHRPPWHEPDVPLTFDVVYEDDDVLAVDKPSGLPTMPAGGFLEHTLLALVRSAHGDVHPVHRLGRGTSGLVLFARHTEAASRLTRALRERDVIKLYRALAIGSPAWDSLDIDVPIGPVPHPRLGTVHAASSDGRPAHTHVVVLERRAAAALVDVRITTGRPHQIRIHLAWAGHALVGDPLYGTGGVPLTSAPGLPGDGGYLLHAHRLTCPHPSGRGTLELEAPPPLALLPARG